LIHPGQWGARLDEKETSKTMKNESESLEKETEPNACQMASGAMRFLRVVRW
jgi:hypothetical protein